MSERRNWTRNETIVALSLFCTIPFNECRASHHRIREVAALIGRTPAALNMKIGNFGRLDPTLAARGITGLTNGSALDESIWDEFCDNFDKLAFESERILTSFNVQANQITLPEGDEIQTLVKQRINQDFFRKMVITSYNNKCCITGVSTPNLLEACHIVGWSEDANNRTNPHNGLSLTPTLHRAYDNMLLAITPDYKVVVSESLLHDSSLRIFTKSFFKSINGMTIAMPDRFAPSRQLLSIHYNSFLSNV